MAAGKGRPRSRGWIGLAVASAILVAAMMAGFLWYRASQTVPPVANQSGTPTSSATGTPDATATPSAAVFDRFAPQPVDGLATKPRSLWQADLPRGGSYSSLGYYDPTLANLLLVSGDEMGVQESPAALVDLTTGAVVASSKQPLMCLPRPFQGNVVCRDTSGNVSLLSTADLSTTAGPKRMGAVESNADTLFDWSPSPDGSQKVRVTAYDAKLTQKWVRDTSFTTIVATEASPMADSRYFVFPQVALPSGGPFVLDAKTGRDVTGLVKGSAFLVPDGDLFVSSGTGATLYRDGVSLSVPQTPNLLGAWQADRARTGLPVLFSRDQAGAVLTARAVDSAGTELWTKELASPVNAYVGGVLVLEATQGAASGVDPKTGRLRWTVPGFTGAVFGDGGTTVVVRTQKGLVAVHSATGATLWQETFIEGTQVFPTARGLVVVAGDRISLYGS